MLTILKRYITAAAAVLVTISGAMAQDTAPRAGGDNQLLDEANSLLSDIGLGDVPSRDSRWQPISEGLGLGFVQALDKPENMRTEMAKSFELLWLNVIGVRYRATPSTYLSVGAGVDWRNYRMTTPGYAFVRSGERNVAIGAYPEGASQCKWSRIKTMSVTFPILVRQELPFNVLGHQRFSVTAGAVLCYNAFGSVKTCYLDEAGNSTKRYFDNIGLRHFSVDLMASISIARNLGIYVKYSPMKVLEEPSLQFRPISCGFVINL